jgi:hypothetical protein
MHLPARLARVPLLAAPVLAGAQEAAPPCAVQPYRGATTPQGALAIVTMSNRGQACRLPVFGNPAERSGPATAGRILVAPRSGTAAFDPPAATYTPAAGFEGTDEFEFEADAVDRMNRPLRLYVRVRVTVNPDR